MTRNRPPTEADIQAGLPGQVGGLWPPVPEPTDALDRIAAGLPVSYGELAAVDPARCPSSPDRRGPHRPDDTTDPLTCAECGALIESEATE